MKNRRYLLFVLLILCFYTIQAQQYYTLKNGLADNDVQSIFQDSFGFLWIGTNNGLSRFDGYEFVNYCQEDGDALALSDNVVHDIAEDEDRNLWIATLYGLNKYDRKNNQIIQYTKGLSNCAVYDIKIRNHQLYAATWDGISILNIRTDSIQNYLLNKNNKWEDAGSSIALVNKTIFMGTNAHGLYQFSLSDKKYTPVQLSGTNNVKVNCLVTLKDLSLLIGTDYGLYRINSQKSLSEAHKIKTDARLNVINNITVIDTNLYLAGNYDIFKADFIQGNELTISENPLISHSDNKVCQVANVTSDNTLWLGFWKNGLASYPINKIHIATFDTKNYPLQEKEVTQIYEDYEGRILLFTYITNNTKAYDFKTQKESIRVNNNNIFIADLDYGNIIQTENKDYWTLRKNTVTQYRRTDGQVLKYSIPGMETYRNAHFFEDKNNNLFLLTSSQLYQFIPNKSGFVLLEKGDFSGNVNALIYLSDRENNRLWVKTYNDFGYFDFDSRKSLIYKDQIVSGIPKVRNINCMYVTSDTTLLLGFKRGMYQLTFSDTIIKTKKIEALSASSVSGIEMDRNHNFWISTFNGILVINKDGKLMFSLYSNHGTGVATYDMSIILKRKNGSIIFGAEDHFVVIEPDKFVAEKQKVKVPLLFTSVSVTGSDKDDIYKLKTQDYLLKEITIPYRYKSISIQFSSIDFIQPDQIEYAYRFKGLDSNWNYLGNKRVVNFSYLAPGDYTFEVKASNSFKEWQNHTNQLHITILPPWYKTIWFRILLALMLLFLFYTIYLIRVRAIQAYNRQLEADIKKRTLEIENQKEELFTQAQTLREVNVLLNERKEELETATDTISKANIELTRLNATKDKFFSIIAHDLKNPFMGILNFTDMLQSQYSSLDDNTKLEYIHHLKQSSQSAYSLLENLLHWSRSQTNLIDYNPELFYIKQLVTDVYQLLRLNADKKKIKLELSISDSLAVYADKNMITTVIRNLVSNAVKFTPEEGRIWINAESHDTTIVISINDNGVGMDTLQKSKLFRIDNHNTTQGTSGEPGTGLGLILCKEFVDKNNGSIRVESEFGKGSSFIITLPVNKEAVVVEAEPLTKSVDESTDIIDPDNELLNKIDETQFKENFVLIVEDTPEIRDALIRCLENSYKLLVAEDGKKGLEIALAEIPDFIISDVMMPGMDGFELARKLKTDERTSHIPLILLTARDSDASQIKGLETGADDYLVKPFKTEVLKTRVKSILYNRKKLREKFTLDVLSEPKDVTTTNTDEEFLKKAIKIVEDNISNTEFSVDIFVAAMGMSRTQLYRKMNQVVGQPINEFFRIIRLKQSAKLLLNPDLNISDVAYKVGFNDLQSFTRSFKKQFGMPPREWVNLKGNKEYKGE